LAASSKKPTIRIKRLSLSSFGYYKYQSECASSITKHRQEKKEKAEKALRYSNPAC
jgi:hypothetical protein